MKNKKIYNIVCATVVVISIAIIVLMNNTTILGTIEKSTALLIKQYLKVIAFAGFLGLLYLYFKKDKKKE